MKERIAYTIDENGFPIDSFIVPSENEYVEGNTVVVSIPLGMSFFKRKWDGEKWTEGATQEEIDKIIGVQIPEPTIEQRTANLESIVNKLLLGGI